jgi:hypothetical protein
MAKSPDPEVLEREQQVVKLRRAGHTWDEIANLVGYAYPSGSRDAYMRAASRVVSEDVKAIRELETERLDNLLNAVWADAMTGDIPAGTQALRIMERRAKLLGLDQPVKIQAEVVTYDADSIESRLIAIISNTVGQDSGTSLSLAGTDGENESTTASE